jgi:hypothetical protein
MFCQHESDTAGVLGGGDAIGKCPLVVGIGGAVPASDMNDAEWAAGKTAGAKQDTTQQANHHTQYVHHGKSPRTRERARDAIIGCV